MNEQKVPHQCAFKVGDNVIYEGMIGIVEDINPVFSYEYWLLDLVSELDPEMTCTAVESECVLYTDQDIDQCEAYSDAKFNSARVLHMVDGITDKYIGDGSF